MYHEVNVTPRQRLKVCLKLRPHLANQQLAIRVRIVGDDR